MSATTELVSNNRAYAAGFDKGDLPQRPAKRVAIVACMDARLDPARALGLAEGDAHVIRNAGGVVTEDTVRSLVISQHLLGTHEVVLLHHTDCGMEGLTDGQLAERLAAETGVVPDFSFGGFADVEDDVRTSATRLRSSPFLAASSIRGFLYDVRTGVVREVATE